MTTPLEALIAEPGIRFSSFGSEAPNIFSRTIALDTARDDELVDTGASNFIWVRDASDFGANINIKFNTQRHGGLNFQQGMIVKLTPFSKIYLTHTAQAGKTITLIYGLQSTDFILENPASSFNNVDVSKSSALSTTPDPSALATATTLILTSNSDRREAIIKNMDSTTALRIGDSSAGAGRGIELEAKQSITLETTAPIYAYNASGSAVSISVTEIED